MPVNLIDTDTLDGFVECYPNAEFVKSFPELNAELWSDGEEMGDQRVYYFDVDSGKKLSWDEVAARR